MITQKSGRCVSFALLSLLSLAPLFQAQTNRPSGTAVSWGETVPSLCGTGHTVHCDCSDLYSHRGLEEQRRGRGVVAIAAGETNNVALKSDGSVAAWGYSTFGQRIMPVGLPPVFANAAGNSYTVALVRDPAPSLTLLRNADQTVSLSWTGAGTLEQTASLPAPNWQPAPNQTNPQTLSTTGAMKFFRVKSD